MKPKLYNLVLVLFLAGLLVSGCDRPAPLPPTVATSTQTINFPIPDRQTVIPQIGTQTAVARTQPAVGVTATPKPVVENTAPAEPQATQAPTKPPVVAAATATSRPVIAVPSATPGRPSTYTIQAGDTFYCLARRYNLNVAEFLNLNGLSNTSLSVIGQVVKIPSSGSWADASGARALKSHPTSYTVQGNDTLNRIACSFGDVDPNAILYANGMSSANDIQAGNTINIP